LFGVSVPIRPQRVEPMARIGHDCSVQQSGRFLAVDGLKALGIMGVVWIHSARSPWDPGAVPLELWSARLAHFAVPGFLAASGFLYASATPASIETTRRRLVRLVVPYLVASLLAQLWWIGQGDGRAPLEGLRELLLGASFGPFYYIFQIVTLVLLAPFVAHLPVRALVPTTLALIVAQLFVNSLDLPLFWALRIPLFSGGSFLLGWSIRRHHEALVALLESRRVAVCAALAAGAVICAWGMTLGLPEFGDRIFEWLYVNLVILLVFALGLGRNTTSQRLSQLSDATFAVFLFHLFFVYAVALVRPLAPGTFDAVGLSLHWMAGMAGALIWLAAARSILGVRSRLWVGA
jgi:surface polysaccharide O-acyltransferase-like enzyme